MRGWTDGGAEARPWHRLLTSPELLGPEQAEQQGREDKAGLPASLNRALAVVNMCPIWGCNTRY